jgi:hypothetical protein
VIKSKFREFVSEKGKLMFKEKILAEEEKRN